MTNKRREITDKLKKIYGWKIRGGPTWAILTREVKRKEINVENGETMRDVDQIIEIRILNKALPRDNIIIKMISKDNCKADCDVYCWHLIKIEEFSLINELICELHTAYKEA